jgi:hypothetical protein
MFVNQNGNWMLSSPSGTMLVQAVAGNWLRLSARAALIVAMPAMSFMSRS